MVFNMKLRKMQNSLLWYKGLKSENENLINFYKLICSFFIEEILYNIYYIIIYKLIYIFIYILIYIFIYKLICGLWFWHGRNILMDKDLHVSSPQHFLRNIPLFPEA